MHTRSKLALSLSLLVLLAAQASAGKGSFFGPPPYGDAYREWKASRGKGPGAATGELYTGVAAPGLTLPTPRQTVVVFEVVVPADAEVWVDDHKGQQTGTRRVFQTPDLPAGKTAHYSIRARWSKDGLPVEETRQLAVEPGTRLRVDFTQP